MRLSIDSYDYSGHLVTITSAEENQFITSLTDHSLTPEGNYYTAGSDRDNEGTFV